MGFILSRGLHASSTINRAWWAGGRNVRLISVNIEKLNQNYLQGFTPLGLIWVNCGGCGGKILYSCRKVNNRIFKTQFFRYYDRLQDQLDG